MQKSVDAQSVDAVRRDEVLDPSIVGVSYTRVFRLDVRQWDFSVTKPALDDRGGVVVVDGAVRVKLVSRVEGVKLAIVDASGSHVGAKVVDYHIYHEVHAAVMKRLGELLQIGRRAEVRVERVDILSPVAMVGQA